MSRVQLRRQLYMRHPLPPPPLSQVELLQNAFASLADAVLEELEEGAAARDEARREQLAALASIRATQDTVQVCVCGGGGSCEEGAKHGLCQGRGQAAMVAASTRVIQRPHKTAQCAAMSPTKVLLCLGQCLADMSCVACAWCAACHQGRLSQVGRLEERVDGQLSAAAGLAGEVAGLAAGLRQQEAAIADLRGEVAVSQAGGGAGGCCPAAAATAPAAPAPACTHFCSSDQVTRMLLHHRCMNVMTPCNPHPHQRYFLSSAPSPPLPPPPPQSLAKALAKSEKAAALAAADAAAAPLTPLQAKQVRTRAQQQSVWLQQCWVPSGGTHCAVGAELVGCHVYCVSTPTTHDMHVLQPPHSPAPPAPPVPSPPILPAP